MIAAAGDPRGWRKRTLAALLLCGLAANAPRFRFAPYQDDHWHALCPRIRAGRIVAVTTNPDWQYVYRRNDPAACRRLH
ncbi:MAG TPA: hypothetical protein VHE61_07325 [Opitutaceae bacterium]|nr:hypothetical protein [Opitutaceae bacterium]